MKKLMLGFAGEMAAGKGTATNFVKVWYPKTPSERFSDSLRGFLVWFNAAKSTGIFAAADAREMRQYLRMGLAHFFSDKIFCASSPNQFPAFVQWVFADWLRYPGPVQESRENLQALSTALRGIFSEDILERTVMTRIRRTRTKSPIAVIEGIRRLVDIGTLLTKPNFRLIYIDIAHRIAYDRILSRNENSGDAEMTWERFLELREAEAEQQIRLLKPHAHLVIDNSGPVEIMERILHAEIAKWLQS